MDAARNQGIDLRRPLQFLQLIGMADLVCDPLGIPTTRSSAWKAVRPFRVEGFDAFSRFLSCHGAETFGAAPSLSETNLSGSGLREAKAIAGRRAHLKSIGIKERQGIEFRTT